MEVFSVLARGKLKVCVCVWEGGYLKPSAIMNESEVKCNKERALGYAPSRNCKVRSQSNGLVTSREIYIEKNETFQPDKHNF